MARPATLLVASWPKCSARSTIPASIPRSSSASTPSPTSIRQRWLPRLNASAPRCGSRTSTAAPTSATAIVVTIDGEHARDFDDAISIETFTNGHYWLGVHIADVAHYVKPGTALDREAYERGTSVYFPERAVHMFPEALATGVCSLNPHVDRLVQSCLMEVTAKGDVVRYEMHDGIIRSDARMTYTAVNAILTERDPEAHRASTASWCRCSS